MINAGAYPRAGRTRRRRIGCAATATALEDAGLAVDPELVVELPWSATMGAEGMDRLLSCEATAHGRLRLLRRGRGGRTAQPAARRHRRCRSAMSVIGIDDHPIADLWDLTTVRQPVELQGMRAARMALDMLDGGPVGERHVVVPTHLVIRGTTGPVGGA